MTVYQVSARIRVENSAWMSVSNIPVSAATPEAVTPNFMRAVLAMHPGRTVDVKDFYAVPDLHASAKMCDAYVVIDDDGHYRCDRSDVYDGSLFPADVSFVSLEEGQQIVAAEPAAPSADELAARRATTLAANLARVPSITLDELHDQLTSAGLAAHHDAATTTWHQHRRSAA